MSEELTQEEVKAILAGKTVPPKRSKFGSQRETVDGIVFASKREAERYRKLKLRQKLGDINHLRLQVNYDLVVNDVLIARYLADFVYEEAETGALVVEDVKGYRTNEYRLKKKLMKAIYQVEILET